MTRIVITYIATLIAFVGIDLIWLGYIARATYVAEMGSLMRKDINLVAAVIFYLIYAAGLMFFAIYPAMRSGSTMQALFMGAAMGFVAYATYDLTNLTVINGFSVKLAIIDLIWGTVLSGASAALVVGVMGLVYGE